MMPLNLYNLLSTKTSWVWYPFCEDIHTSGFTPNVADQTDGGALKLSLTSFGAGEYVGSGIAKFVDGKLGYLFSSGSFFRISGDISILYQCNLSGNVTSETEIVLLQYAAGETSATNVQYEIRRWRPTGAITYNHEHTSGSDVTVNASAVFPKDDNDHFLAMTRNTTLKTYNTYVDDSGVITVSYSTNPTGGGSTNFNLPGGGLIQSNGAYRNLFIFNEVLTSGEIETIRLAGSPDVTWFDYSNWNGTTGYVTWVYSSPPTTRSITLKKDISPILINQRVTAYRLNSHDKIQVKLALNNKGKKSYLTNIPVEFYLNYSSTFEKYVDTVTDSTGTAIINYSCQNIEEDINSCVGYAKVTIGSNIYTSNLVRFNFCSGAGVEKEAQLYPAEVMLYSSNINF